MAGEGERGKGLEERVLWSYLSVVDPKASDVRLPEYE